MKAEQIPILKNEFIEKCEAEAAKDKDCKSKKCNRFDCEIKDCENKESQIKKFRESLCEILNKVEPEVATEFFKSLVLAVETMQTKESKSIGYQTIGIFYNCVKDYPDSFNLSINYLSKAIEGCANKAKLYYNMGVMNGLANKHKEAIPFFKSALKEDEGFILAHFNLYFTYHIIADFKKSQEHAIKLDQYCSSVSEKKKGDIDFWITWGENSLYHLQDIDGAIEIFMKAKTNCVITDNPWIDYHLSVAYFTKNNSFFEVENEYYDNLQKAREHKVNAIKLLKEKGNFETYISDLFYLDKEYKKALEYSEKAINEEPNNVDIIRAHGQIFLQLDKIKESIKFFKEALYLSNGENEIRNNLAEAYRRNNQFSDARFELMTSLSFDKQNLEALKGLINLNIEMGDDNDENGIEAYDAIEYFEEARELSLKLLNKNNSNFKHLGRPELSHQYFLLGYINYKLYFLNDFKERSYIKNAISNYKKVEAGSRYFYKSKAIQSKIQNFLNKLDKRHNKSKSIKILGGVIIFLGLLLFLTGKPNWIGSYKINHSELKNLIEAGKMKVPDSSFISDIDNNFFSSETAVTNYLERKGIIMDNAALAEFKVVEDVSQLSHFERVDDLLLFTILLSGVILLVLGSIINEVKTLKLPGGIELEKNALEIEMSPTKFKITRD